MPFVFMPQCALTGHRVAEENHSPSVSVNEQSEHGEEDGQDELDHRDNAMTPAEDHLLHEHPVEMGPLQSPPRQLDVVVVES